MLKNINKIATISILTAFIAVATTGCSTVFGSNSSASTPKVVAPDTSKQSLEEKIAMIEKADMPAPAKKAAIEKLKQGK